MTVDDESIEYVEALRREIAHRYPLLSAKLPLSDHRVASHLSWNEGMLFYNVIYSSYSRKTTSYAGSRFAPPHRQTRR